MAFDMYLGDRHEKIDHHEEYVFSLASAFPDQCAGLNALWSAFYSTFELTPQQANELVHELLFLLGTEGSVPNKPLSALVIRLAIFFSAATRLNLPIACAGD